MKKLLLPLSGIVILLMTAPSTKGQTILLAEDFSGFNVGSHTTPSTSDVSSTLDLKTSMPGWAGSMIYPAGGEIKIGTSSSTGWIETPPLDLSQNSGNFSVIFDLARWPGDATTVQVYLNNLPVGSILSPTDEFQTVTVKCNDGTLSGKIKIMALTKRFYIDNLSVVTENLATHLDKNDLRKEIVLYPVPAGEDLRIKGIEEFCNAEIFDITGRVIMSVVTGFNETVIIPVSEINSGIYFIRFSSPGKMKQLRFVKE